MSRYICIHAHFYQPPRENPWTGRIPIQESAAPFHDWNERISAECYAPNTAARILDQQGQVIELCNNFSEISFDCGPTLLSWLQKRQPKVYQAILEADRLSAQKFSGRGSALAQAYNHVVLPLANQRDKRTQVIWAIADFQERFGRAPEGMWLPETAVDTPTLEVVAEAGIRFTILAPRQASRLRAAEGQSSWEDASDEKIDPTVAYRCPLPSGRSIDLFFYNGPISKEVAFEELLKDGHKFAERLLGAFSANRKPAQLVHLATDGETFGHHHRFGEMALAYCLRSIRSNSSAKIVNHSEFLHRHPPRHVVEIAEETSWSCAHGLGRWKENCGCHSGRPDWTRAWRRPLRRALDRLRDRLALVFEGEGGRLLQDPWEARDRYIEVLIDRSADSLDKFIAEQARSNLTSRDRARAAKLLEMQHQAMLMYTSCAWFYDEISGIESVQNLLCASRAIQLAEEISGKSLEAEFVAALEEAPSNRCKNGAQVYEKLVKPQQIDLAGKKNKGLLE